MFLQESSDLTTQPKPFSLHHAPRQSVIVIATCMSSVQAATVSIVVVGVVLVAVAVVVGTVIIELSLS